MSHNTGSSAVIGPTADWHKRDTYRPIVLVGVDADQRLRLRLGLVLVFIVIWVPLVLVAVIANARNHHVPSWDSWLLFVLFWLTVMTLAIGLVVSRRAAHRRDLP